MNIEDFIETLKAMQKNGQEKILLTEVIDMAYNTEEYHAFQIRKQWREEMREYKKTHKTRAHLDMWHGL